MPKQKEEKSKQEKKQDKAKNIGIDLPIPESTCQDKHCPFHGNLKPRGKIFEGVVLKTSGHRSAMVGWPRLYYLPKYERYEKRRTKIMVHNPECIHAEVGDKVKVMECKPISKMKHFVIVQKLSKNESS